MVRPVSISRLLKLSLYLSIFFTRVAWGDTVFDSIGTNGSSSSPFYSPGWHAQDVSAGFAGSFTVGPADHQLTSISIAIGYIQGTNNLAISIRPDNGGLPGAFTLDTFV